MADDPVLDAAIEIADTKAEATQEVVETKLEQIEEQTAEVIGDVKEQVAQQAFATFDALANIEKIANEALNRANEACAKIEEMAHVEPDEPKEEKEPEESITEEKIVEDVENPPAPPEIIRKRKYFKL